jgi:hypothetical protein
MITNASCTIYNTLPDGTYKRTFIPAVFWRNVKAEQIQKYGAENASSVTVMIFIDELQDYVLAEKFKGDGWTADTLSDTYIVKGECSDEVTDDIGVLYENNREVYKVCKAEENFYGSTYLQHVLIEGK